MVKKDGCLSSRRSGMEACIQLLKGNIPKGGIHTLSVIIDVCTVIGVAIGIVSLILYLYDRKKK